MQQNTVWYWYFMVIILRNRLFQIMILTTAVYEIYSLPWPMREVHLYWLSKEPLALQDPTPSNWPDTLWSGTTQAESSLPTSLT